MHIKQNKFPKQFKIGKRAIAWLESDFDAWIDESLARME
ncbi:AlpA family phage regulatory protein [Snodgrassella alvi]